MDTIIRSVSEERICGESIFLTHTYLMIQSKIIYPHTVSRKNYHNLEKVVDLDEVILNVFLFRNDFDCQRR